MSTIYKLLTISTIFILFSNALSQDDFCASLKVVEKYKTQFGLQVLCDVDRDDYFPPYWKNKKISPKAEATELEHAKRLLYDIYPSLHLYSKNFLSNNLKGIKLSKSLSFYEINYGGTNSTDDIYLTVGEVTKGFSKKYNIGNFHHEFSSIIKRNYKSFFPEKTWKSLLPTSFKYLGSGSLALKEGVASLKGSPELYKEGFLSQYSKASIEEDFNMIAGTVFSNPSLMNELKNEYPKLNEKYELWLNFMKTVDPKFTGPLDF